MVDKISYRYVWEDAFWRTLLAPITKTVWAKDFSEAGFAKVRYEMTNSEVSMLVGEPLDKDCDKEGCTWSYSNQHKDAVEFDRRWVSFDTKGRVNYIWHEFHID